MEFLPCICKLKKKKKYPIQIEATLGIADGGAYQSPKRNSCRHAILLTISDSIKGNLISIITRWARGASPLNGHKRYSHTCICILAAHVSAGYRGNQRHCGSYRWLLILASSSGHSYSYGNT